jgi:hypothetical protein
MKNGCTKRADSQKGKPPAWTPPNTTTKLKADDGNYFLDPNAASYPAHPIQPAVQAIFTSQPDYPVSTVDVFACSNALGNLLRFVRKVDKPFRMLVEAVGDTVFFVRRERSPTELIPNVIGFGHTFPEAYTTWEAGIGRSESHQRVVGYTFGGLDCLVRFAADGYHKNLVSEEFKFERAPEPAESGNLDDILASALDNSTIAAHSSAPDKPLTVIRGGQRIPQSAIFNLKTRSIHKKDQDILGGELPRLWVAQIPNFILAYHASGVFEEIQIRNVRHEVENWERENEDTLRRFAVLLRKIVAFARGRADRKFEVRRREVDILELREQNQEVGHTLSADVEARWVAGKSDEPDCPDDGSQGQDVHYISESDDENVTFGWDEGSEKDFTACSAEDCGYCGHCSY